MEWEEKITVKKGNLAEEIIQNFLENKGYIVYKSITNKAHAFDFLAVKNKKIFIIAEVKAKARMNKYEATGIDVKHFNEYKHIYENQGFDIVLVFVDEHPKSENIYCQKLSELMKEKIYKNTKYPNTSIKEGIILFALDDMIEIGKLTKEQIKELKKYSSRNYDYI